MTGLIYKDFLALKGHLSTYVVFFVIYGGLCIAGVFSPSVLAGMVVLISIITPMTTVTSDDISRWNRFAVASPACRRGVVAGKYLFTPSCWLFWPWPAAWGTAPWPSTCWPPWPAAASPCS